MLAKMPQSESKEAIAQRLEITRVALGYTKQAKFASAIGGVTPQRWNNYESGRDRLTLNLALVICRKFPQVTLDWLYRGDKGSLRPAFSAAVDDAERVLKRLRR
jgi:DNA-binding XRE family transcriptional regulator